MPVPEIVAFIAVSVLETPTLNQDALFGSDEFKTLNAVVVDVPFGIAINRVALFVVLV